MDEIATGSWLDQAYACLCEGRRDDSQNDDVWDARQRASFWRAGQSPVYVSIRQVLSAGRCKLGIAHIPRVSQSR
jgi:hypothetical protein